ncbi:MAG: M67 family metallopeptidase [Cyclobacteriaceae bacterium]
MNLTINTTVYDTMKVQAEAAYPLECVGFLFGTEAGNERHLKLARPVVNSMDGDQRRRFVIDPKDYLAAEKYSLANNIALLGIYHSHPDHPARPSQHDLKQAVPYFSYIILSIMNEELTDTTSWQLNDHGRFEEEPIEIKNENTINLN